MSESTLKSEEFQDETMMKTDDDASKQEATASVTSPKKLRQTSPVKLGTYDTSTVSSVNEGDGVHTENRVSSKHGDAFPELNLHGGSDGFIFIEACAGCGILSSVAKEQGFLVVPLDCPRNQHKTKVKIVTIDLTAPHADYLLRRLVQDYNVIAVHFGLPCGTCSKARGIPMADGSPGPQPLRDFSFLHGLPDLSDQDRLKVEAANALYKWADSFIQLLDKLGIAWTVENPGNSWLWELPEMAFALSRGAFVHLHPCAYGGTRKKNTAFLASEAEFAILERFCDGSHPHEGWGYDHKLGVFNTSKEAEYPRGLCLQYVRVLHQLLEKKGYKMSCNKLDAKIKPLQQRGGRSLPQVISEFERVQTINLQMVPMTDNKSCIVSAIGNIPKGSKLLRTEATKGGKILCVFGVFRDMSEFVKLSRQLFHPFDLLTNLPDVLIRCIFRMVTLGPIESMKQRINTLKKWQGWARELQQDEDLLHNKMDVNIKKCLEGKRLLLLEKIACSLGWPDTGVHDELRSGFKLTGYAKPCGIFKTEPKLAPMDKTKLMEDSKFLKPALLGKVKQHTCDDDHCKLYEMTLKEANVKGWLEGPYEPEQVTEMINGPWMPVRRFGIWQKGKLRPIDDFRENRVNEAFSCGDKIDLHAMDNMLWTLLAFMRFTLHQEHCRLETSDGEVLSGQVHPLWKSMPKGCQLTAFDLESAYKQLPLHESEYDCTVVTLKGPEPKDGPKCFFMRTLPFGSVASVLHFNRVARLLWRVGIELNLMWFNYFDDYPCISPSIQSKSTMMTVKGIFGLLGFKFAEDKLSDFANTAEMLGVMVDASKSDEGLVKVDNKESRKSEVVNALNDIIRDACLVPADLPALIGRLQFADMQLSGRGGKLAMADIREIGNESKQPHKLDADVIEAFELLKTRFSQGEPRSFLAEIPTHPIVVFTDGALETSDDGTLSATIGAVALFPNGSVSVFGSRVDSSVLNAWLQEHVHPIGLIELYGVGAAYQVWREGLSNRKAIFFCDNWAALDVYVKGSSSQRSWRTLLKSLEKIDIEARALIWMARVPSQSNISDAPSRGDVSALEFLKPYSTVIASCPVTGKRLESIIG